MAGPMVPHRVPHGACRGCHLLEGLIEHTLCFQLLKTNDKKEIQGGSNPSGFPPTGRQWSYLLSVSYGQHGALTPITANLKENLKINQ